MTSISFTKWLKCIKKLDESKLSHSERDELFDEYTKSSLVKSSPRNQRKQNAKAREVKSSATRATSKERNRWISDYLGYVYDKATKKQRTYFDKEYKRYCNRDTFVPSELSEDEWGITYSPFQSCCSDQMQINAHREYEWFITTEWVYQPMSFVSFVSLFYDMDVSKSLTMPENTCDDLCSNFYSYLHDCAADREDFWIDKLAPREEIPGEAVTWEDLGILVDENGNPLRKNFCYKESN